MVAHSETAYVIDPSGHTRAVLNANPGTSATSASSFATLLSDQLRAVLGT